MEILFSEDDLEPLEPLESPGSGKKEKEKPAPAAKSVRAQRGTAAKPPEEGSLFGDLEAEMGLEPVFEPAAALSQADVFGAVPAALNWVPVSDSEKRGDERSVKPRGSSESSPKGPDGRRRGRRKKPAEAPRSSGGETPSHTRESAGGAVIIRSSEDVNAFAELREDGTTVEVDGDTCADPEVFAADRRARSAGKPKEHRSVLMRAVDALSRREYSRRDLTRKLCASLNEGETREDVKAALDRLEEMGLLSDERFAEMKVRASAGRLGNMRLRQELRMSGVSEETIAAAMASVEEPEELRAYRMWRRRWSEPPENWKEREKMVRYLATRGFSMSAIQKVLRGEVDLSE
ncbi:recombination regulator RecX [Sutterella sp.]|uniref:recombination regulator RecX n=1 Tax=Sutterella sp. TaxID=1981025 RepID=UPI0026DEE5E7|nr:recombination regulator RecX [Sutterella sp.]MDO5532400.1 recombination regulator RecX [Sutterella sp.]